MTRFLGHYLGVALAGFVLLTIIAIIRRLTGVPANPYVGFAVYVVAMVIGFVSVAIRAFFSVTGVWRGALMIIAGVAGWVLCMYLALLVWANSYGT